MYTSGSSGFRVETTLDLLNAPRGFHTRFQASKPCDLHVLVAVECSARFRHFETSTCTPRFTGVLGQLIGAGRCGDLLDACVRSYENCLGRMSHPFNSPEFGAKELVLAHGALKDKVDPERVRRWEKHWRQYRADCAFNCCYRNLDNNFNTFGLTGEFLRLLAGLGGSPELVDRLIEKELDHIDGFRMYHDPACPLTYHVVVLQQLAMVLRSGYDGVYRSALDAAVRRGCISSLFMQSATGQAPFGGRSNQFYHIEAQSAAFRRRSRRRSRRRLQARGPKGRGDGVAMDHGHGSLASSQAGLPPSS